jgi:hypothetical protein
VKVFHPPIDFLFHRILTAAVEFLDFAFELFTFARDFVEISIREMTLLLLELALERFPVSFNAIPIHCGLLMVKLRQELNCYLAGRVGCLYGIDR